MAAVPVLTVEPEVQSTRTFRHVLSVIARDPLSLASTIVIILFILVAIGLWIFWIRWTRKGESHAAQ